MESKFQKIMWLLAKPLPNLKKNKQIKKKKMFYKIGMVKLVFDKKCLLKWVDVLSPLDLG